MKKRKAPDRLERALAQSLNSATIGSRAASIGIPISEVSA